MIYRLDFEQNKIVHKEIILKDRIGRIRDIEIDSKGNLYISEDKNTENLNKYGSNRVLKLNYQDPYNIETILEGKDNIGEATGLLLNPDETKLSLASATTSNVPSPFLYQFSPKNPI